MEKNLFQQAKEMVNQITNNQSNTQDYQIQEKDKQAAIKAIQEAYHDATPEEQEQLTQFEQDLNKKMS